MPTNVQLESRTKDLEKTISSVERSMQKMEGMLSGNGQIINYGKRLGVDRSVNISQLLNRITKIEETGVVNSQSYFGLVDHPWDEESADNALFPSTISRKVGIKTKKPVSLLEIWDNVAHPTLTISAKHDADYDPQVQYRIGTDPTPIVTFSHGVDSGDSNKWKLAPGAGGVGGSTDFVVDQNGDVGIGTNNPNAGSLTLVSKDIYVDTFYYFKSNRGRWGSWITNADGDVGGFFQNMNYTGSWSIINAGKPTGLFELDTRQGDLGFTIYLDADGASPIGIDAGGDPNIVVDWTDIALKFYAQSGSPLSSQEVLNITTTYFLIPISNVGIGVSDPISGIELYRSAEHPILTITAAHNTDYDPQINFRTDATPTIKWAIRVDGTNDNLYIDYVAGSGYMVINTTLAKALEIGNAEPAVDYYIEFNGETNNGIFRWMEDEDYFKFDDDVLMNSTEKIHFNDTNNSIYYVAPNGGTGGIHIDSNLAITLDANDVVIGDGTADVDYRLIFDGESSVGIINWKEDEDYFLFEDDIMMLDQEKIYFDSTDTYIGANADDPEDLVIAADQDILLVPGNNVGLSGNIYPLVADGGSVGTPTNEFSDAYFADGGIVYFGHDQDTTLTHTHNVGLSVNNSFGVGDSPDPDRKLEVLQDISSVTGKTTIFAGRFESDITNDDEAAFQAYSTSHILRYRGTQDSTNSKGSRAIDASLFYYNTGTISHAAGFRLDQRNLGAGTITNLYGAWVPLMVNSGGGTVENTFGVKVDAQTVGTNNYAFYAANTNTANRWNFYAAGGAPNFFKGEIQIDSDTAGLVLGAGQDSSIIYNGTDMITDYDLLNSGTTDYRIQENGTDRLVIFTGGVAQFYNDIVLPKTSGKGIKVDTATPTFPWKDLLGDQFSKNTGASKPTLAEYNDPIDAWQFGDGDEAFLTFHIPHDYVAGTDIHLHIHWSQTYDGVTGGDLDFKYSAIYAKGHNQQSFGAPITGLFSSIVLADDGLDQYRHHLTEVIISAATATGALFDRDDFEPDGVIELTFEMVTNNLTGVAVTDPFIHYVDIHYQSTNIGTKNKVPDFYS